MTTTTHGTPIEWTHVPGYRGETWNPIVGCSPDSTGCLNCYAAQLAGTRLRERPEYAGLVTMRSDGQGGQRAVYNGILRLVPERAEHPLHWREPRAVFVGDMTDIFHAEVPTFALDRLFAVMARTPQHLYLLLTKRPHRMREYLTDPETPERVARAAGNISAEGDRNRDAVANGPWPLPNVWLGTSAENQAAGERRIPELMCCPVAEGCVLYVSYEPAVGPLNLRRLQLGYDVVDALTGYVRDGDTGDIAWSTPGRIGWVVDGGESGHRARPWHPDWFRRVRDDCAATGVPYLHKQHGAWTPEKPERGPRKAVVWRDGRAFAPPWPDPEPDSDPCMMWCVGKKAAGRLLDGRLHNAFPEVRRHA